MADKQIKDYAITPLADTDSLVKQSVTGLTGKATLTDIKSNLDGRYQVFPTEVWTGESTSATIAEIKRGMYLIRLKNASMSPTRYTNVIINAPALGEVAHRMIVSDSGTELGVSVREIVINTTARTVTFYPLDGVDQYVIFSIIDLGAFL